MNRKHCPHCHFSTEVVRIGTTSSGKQRSNVNDVAIHGHQNLTHRS